MALLDQLGINGTHLVIQVLGFLILYWVLSKFLFGPVQTMFSTREHAIKTKLDEAEEKRQEMIRMRDEYEARIADIEAETRHRIEDAMSQAQVARDELLAHAREQAQRIMQRGHAEVQREKEKALVEIRNRVADLAVLTAGQLIRKDLDDSTHRQLAQEIIEGIGRN